MAEKTSEKSEKKSFWESFGFAFKRIFTSGITQDTAHDWDLVLGKETVDKAIEWQENLKYWYIKPLIIVVAVIMVLVTVKSLFD